MREYGQKDKVVNKDKKNNSGKADAIKKKDKYKKNFQERKNSNEKSSLSRKKNYKAGNGADKSRKQIEKDFVNRDDAVFCKYVKKCGGCVYQDMDYEKQLRKKKKAVQKLLADFCEVEEIYGMEHPYHYRHKVHAAFGHARGKGVIAGVYKEGTHEIVDVEGCKIENEKAGAIIRDIKGLLKDFKIKVYDEDSGYGLFRHVLIRSGYHTGEIMVVLVLSSPILPSKNNFVKALRKLHPEITTVVINVNDRHTSMVLGEKESVIYGKGYIEDVLCGKTFRISPSSFYQVNPAQTEVLYQKAIEMANLTGNERVIDAYCGTGTIGIIAAEHAKEVIGVELNRNAVKDAVTNAKRNNVKNISFYQADAGKFMSQMAAEEDSADLVIMDPPRSGSSEEFLESLCYLSPQKVVYISCNPETQARDLAYLTKKGYEVKKAVAVDLFPFTVHVETVCLLSKKAQ